MFLHFKPLKKSLLILDWKRLGYWDEEEKRLTNTRIEEDKNLEYKHQMVFSDLDTQFEEFIVSKYSPSKKMLRDFTSNRFWILNPVDSALDIYGVGVRTSRLFNWFFPATRQIRGIQCTHDHIEAINELTFWASRGKATLGDLFLGDMMLSQEKCETLIGGLKVLSPEALHPFIRHDHITFQKMLKPLKR